MTIIYLSKDLVRDVVNVNGNTNFELTSNEFPLNYNPTTDKQNVLEKKLNNFLFLKGLFNIKLNHKKDEGSSDDFIRNIQHQTNGSLRVFDFFDLNQLLNYISKFPNEALFLNQQKVAALIFMNSGFLFLYILGTILIKIFFDELRDIENQHMYDRVLNFLLFKVVFLGAIVETNNDEMILWVSWFAVIGFLRVFSMLCRDRCEYLMEISSSSNRSQFRVLSFLSLIIICDILWFTVCLNSFGSMLFLLIFECFTLLLDTLQTLIKYLIHIKDISSSDIWEEKDVYLRKTEFYTDAAILVVTLIHYIQIVLLQGITFTLIDAVLFLNIRSVFKSLHRKYNIYKSYRSALNYMESRFPSATKNELEDLGDNCPICLEPMISAQKLPCSHIFHGRCLRLWLESHQNCPTCRKDLDKSADDEEALIRSSNARRISSINHNGSENNTSLLSHQNSSSPGLGFGWDRDFNVINTLNY
ncbi:hypothetical protein K502DRAFT_325255 [Neoconidiobolus thromboides FSU 785]|nr:hypothetical protein K502DRAFT_325255 [Neoconidiobolus thromboides FSU 785]